MQRPLARRDVLMGGAFAALVASCRVMAQVRASDALIARPEPSDSRAVLAALVVTVLPFELPSFPRAFSPDEMVGRIREMFALDTDPEMANLPKALALFDTAETFSAPPAPTVDDERRDLRMSRVPPSEVPHTLHEALAQEARAGDTFVRRYGSVRFVEQRIEARRAYLAMWSASGFITRRRFYRGIKTMVSVAAYSTRPFWDAVGYEGPLLRQP